MPEREPVHGLAKIECEGEVGEGLLVSARDRCRIAGIGIDIVFEVPALILIDFRKGHDELTIHVGRGPVFAHHPSLRDDHHPHESRVDVLGFVEVRVIHPHDRTALVRGRPRSLRHGPDIPVRPPRWHPVVRLIPIGGSIVVHCSLGVLVVEDPMGVHGIGAAGVVAEYHDDGITDLAAEHRAEIAEVLPLRRALLHRGEGTVGVFPVHRLLVDTANAIRGRGQQHLHQSLCGATGHHVGARRCIVPLDLFGGHIVGASGRCHR